MRCIDVDEGALSTMPLPTIGQALRIRERNASETYFRSRFVDIQSDTLFIEPPTSADGIPMVFADGLSFWIDFRAPDGALCMFPTNVIRIDEYLHQWVVARPQADEILRQQRREFVRVEVDIPVRLEYPFGGAARVVDVRTKDISGGGIGLWLPQQATCSSGQLVTTKFTLPKDQFSVDVKCAVIRVSERNNEGYAIASMQFHGIREAVRQKIIQFTFWRQRYLIEMFGSKESKGRSR